MDMILRSNGVKMSEKAGIKETVEVIELIGVVAEAIIRELRTDGLQLSDAVKIVMSPAFQVKLAEALSGIGGASDELQDLSKIEALDLAEIVLKTVRGIVQSLAEARAA
jgi:hypothetical protein